MAEIIDKLFTKVDTSLPKQRAEALGFGADTSVPKQRAEVEGLGVDTSSPKLRAEAEDHGYALLRNSEGQYSPVHLKNRIGMVLVQSNPKLQGHPFKHILTKQDLLIFQSEDTQRIRQMLISKGYDLSQPVSFFLSEEDAEIATKTLLQNACTHIPTAELTMDDTDTTLRTVIHYRVTDKAPEVLRKLTYGRVNPLSLKLEEVPLQNAVITLIVDQGKPLFVQTCYPKDPSEAQRFMMETSSKCQSILKMRQKAGKTIFLSEKGKETQVMKLYGRDTSHECNPKTFAFQIEKIRPCGTVSKRNYFNIKGQLNCVTFFADSAYQFNEFIDCGHPLAVIMKGHKTQDMKRAAETVGISQELKIHSEYNSALKIALRGGEEEMHSKFDKLKELLASLKPLMETSETSGSFRLSDNCYRYYSALVLNLTPQLENNKFDLKSLQELKNLIETKFLSELQAIAKSNKERIDEQHKKQQDDLIASMRSKQEVLGEVNELLAFIVSVQNGRVTFTAEPEKPKAKSASVKLSAQDEAEFKAKKKKYTDLKNKILEQLKHLEKNAVPVTIENLTLALKKRIALKYIDIEKAKKTEEANLSIKTIENILTQISAMVSGRIKVLESAEATLLQPEMLAKEIVKLQTLLATSRNLDARGKSKLEHLCYLKDHIHQIAKQFSDYFHHWISSKDAIPSLSLKEATIRGLDLKRNENLTRNLMKQLNKALAELLNILPKEQARSHEIIAFCTSIRDQINGIQNKLKSGSATLGFELCNEAMRVAEAFYAHPDICSFFKEFEGSRGLQGKEAARKAMIETLKESHNHYKEMRAAHIQMTTCSSFQRHRMSYQPLPKGCMLFTPNIAPSTIQSSSLEHEFFGFFVALQQLDAEISALERHYSHHPLKVKELEADAHPLLARSQELLLSLEGQIMSLIGKKSVDYSALTQGLKSLTQNIGNDKETCEPLPKDDMSKLLLLCQA